MNQKHSQNIRHANVNVTLMIDKYNLNQKWNKHRWESKNLKDHHVCENNYIWDPATCSFENDKHLKSIIDNSVIMCDEIIEKTKNTSIKTILTKSISMKINSKKFY